MDEVLIRVGEYMEWVIMVVLVIIALVLIAIAETIVRIADVAEAFYEDQRPKDGS